MATLLKAKGDSLSLALLIWMQHLTIVDHHLLCEHFFHLASRSRDFLMSLPTSKATLSWLFLLVSPIISTSKLWNIYQTFQILYIQNQITALPQQTSPSHNLLHFFRQQFTPSIASIKILGEFSNQSLSFTSHCQRIIKFVGSPIKYQYIPNLTTPHSLCPCHPSLNYCNFLQS